MSERKTRNWRRGILALVMLAVLLASIGVAWWYTSLVQGRNRAGGEIVALMRAKGLAAWWGKEARTDWRLVSARGAVQGWQAEVRGPAGQNIFMGVSALALGDKISLERWQLSDNLARGLYYAQDTIITLKDAVVIVVQKQSGGLPARSPAPENYLPEGTVELAVRLVAQKREDAQFKMVFNERPNYFGTVEFGNVRMSYRGRTRADGGEVGRVRLDYGGESAQREYLVDPHGRIVQIESGKVIWRLAGPEEIQSHFPDAAGILRRLTPAALLQQVMPAEEGKELPPPSLKPKVTGT